MLLSFISLCVDAGVVPPGSEPYPYFVAIQSGLTSAMITCLLINGFVGFQLYEDGTPLSIWMLRLSSFAAFVVSFLVSLATFKSWAGMGPENTVGLFTVLYLLNGVQLIIYVALQILLVVRTLEDRWPLGDIAFGLFFFIVGQVILYALSSTICQATSHYVDGLFFATICNLLAVMMVYKVCHIRIYDQCINTSNLFTVLGFNHQGRPRVLRWYPDEQLGSERASPRRRAPCHHLHRRPL